MTTIVDQWEYHIGFYSLTDYQKFLDVVQARAAQLGISGSDVIIRHMGKHFLVTFERAPTAADIAAQDAQRKHDAQKLVDQLRSRFDLPK